MKRVYFAILLTVGLMGCVRKPVPSQETNIGDVPVEQFAPVTASSNRIGIEQVGEYQGANFVVRALVATDKTTGCQTYLFKSYDGLTSQPVPGTCTLP